MTSPADLDTSAWRAEGQGLSGVERALGALQSKTLEALSASLLSRPLMRIQMKRYLRRLRLVPSEEAHPHHGEGTATAGVAALPPIAERQGLDRLRVIHIGGTKGKGSTGAFVERILREHAVSTGLNTSPHLVRLTERIRLNGTPVDDATFTAHFWAVWDKLVATRDEAEGDPIIPAHFRFLTLVAFHMFLTHALPRPQPLQPGSSASSAAAGADAAPIECVILEVGMGGRLDATNVASPPWAVGFSSIGYDHQEVLGYTLTSIAGEKAGIIKPHCEAFSTANQVQEVKDVFNEVAKQEHANMTFVPSLDAEAQENTAVKLGLAGVHQYENAGLACALAWHFLCAMSREHPEDDRFAEFRPYANQGKSWVDLFGPGSDGAGKPIPEKFRRALEQTSWPGRCQKLLHPRPELRDRLGFYVDGAHTDASMRVACDWFQDLDASERGAAAAAAAAASSSAASPPPSPSYSLLFNCGHVRDPIELLVPVVGLAYPKVDVGISTSTPAASAAGRRHSRAASVSSAAAAAAAAAVSAAQSTDAGAAQSPHPIRFSRVLCSPFDHDRPHLLAAPSFEKLLRNYLLPMPRPSNVSVAKQTVQQQQKKQPSGAPVVAGSVSPAAAAADVPLSPSIHPVLLRLLEDRFAFPPLRMWEVELELHRLSTPDADANADRRAALETEHRHLEHVVLGRLCARLGNFAVKGMALGDDAPREAFVRLADVAIQLVIAEFPQPQQPQGGQSSDAAAVGAGDAPPRGGFAAPESSWQLTLFRVWALVQRAFEHSSGEASADGFAPTACEYYPSVRSALSSLEAEASSLVAASASSVSPPMKVLVCGSLYIVGNVLQALDFHV